MLLWTVGAFLLALFVFVLLIPRAGMLIGPLLIVLGVAPVLALFFVPAASHARMEEQYGMLSTIAFLLLTPLGVMISLIGFFMKDR